MNQNPSFFENSELFEIERDITELQLDLQSNTNAILMRPLEMKPKIDNFLKTLSQISSKLNFLKKSQEGLDYKKVSELEKKIAILQNQLELDIKMLQKV